MTQLKGEGVIVNKEERRNGDFTNYSYEITVSASKANKSGVIPTANIRLSANKNLGGSIGSGVEFTAELVPYTKKDGTGSSYLFRALSMKEVEVKKADNTPACDIDDEFPPF